MQQELTRIYAAHFTEQELKDALAFFKTPLGKKLISEEPKALEASMKAEPTTGHGDLRSRSTPSSAPRCKNAGTT